MFKAYTLTLDGTAQRLSDAFKPTGSPAGTIDAALDLPCATMIFSSLKANSADIFIGSEGPSATTPTSSSSHAFRIDPGDTAPPISVWAAGSGAPVKPSDFYAVGTSTQVLCFGMVVQ